MPDTNLPDNDVLTSAFYNTNIREQVVTTCTSITRPTGLAGRLISETDTGMLMRYDGATWQPAHVAAGVIASSSGFTTGTGIETVSYGVSFASVPIVVCNVDVSTTAEVTWFISDRTVSDFTVRIYLSGALYTAGGGNIQFIACGTVT